MVENKMKEKAAKKRSSWFGGLSSSSKQEEEEERDEYAEEQAVRSSFCRVVSSVTGKRYRYTHCRLLGRRLNRISVSTSSCSIP